MAIGSLDTPRGTGREGRLDGLLAGLSPAQAEAVTCADAPLAIVAGPGSGKTRVLTRRVAYRCRGGGADPAHTLVLTFSRRAASELLHRLGSLGLPTRARSGGVTAGTFHGVAWAELCRHRAEHGLPAPALLGRPRRLLAPALEQIIGRAPLAGEVAAAAGEIGWARARGLAPGRYEAEAARVGRLPGRFGPELLLDVWAAYEQAKRHLRVLDLDDLLAATADLLLDDAEAAAIAHWRHRHFFVDEYQDLNTAHRRLLHAWVGDRPDVCLVGDPDQAVYGFNGSDPDLFDRVDTDWPGARVLALNDNFRSTPEIVSLATAIRPATVSLATAIRPATATPATPATATPASPHVSRRPPGALPTAAGHASEAAEAAAVAAAVACLPGRGRGQVAVLARTNARLRVVSAALDALGVPWRLRDPRPLTDRPGVRSWLDSLPPSAAAADLAEVLMDGDGDPDAIALTAALRDYRDASHTGTVARFTDWLDAAGVTADEGAPGGVDLATFHRAKGLEWPSVWVVGLEEGLVPLSAADESTLAEEQRLLYVALTRAEDALHLSWAGTRPSRWLAPIGDRLALLTAEPSPDEQRRRLAALLRCLRAA